MPNPMLEYACLCSKPLRNDNLQKIAIIHHKNSRKKPNFPDFVLSVSPRFLTRILKTLFENYTSLQARSNGRIREFVLKTG